MVPLPDESVLRRWLQLEIGRINEGMVTERKRLSVLRSEESPRTVTRRGDVYRFDPGVIRSLADALPREIHACLRLPIQFRQRIDVPDSWYLDDEVAVRALQIVGDLSPMRRMHDSRLWVSRPIAASILRKYPTAVQVVVG